MRLDRLELKSFKNLERFKIDFDETQLTTVLIGENGTGKSNLIEAIVQIFRDLDLNQPTPFAYRLLYRCRNCEISLINDGESARGRPRVTVSGADITSAEFQRRKADLLPGIVFGYYSGNGRRLESLFDKHQERYYQEIISPQRSRGAQPTKPPLRPFFYCRRAYGSFALLALLALGDDKTRRFLKRYLGITGFHSALFVLRRPYWAQANPSDMAKESGDPRFWYARGLVAEFLAELWDRSLAPISHTERVKDDYREKGSREERLYLFVKDQDELARLGQRFGDAKAFFQHLESTDISDLIREVRVWVTREGSDHEMPFHEISDGERQLLTVLGLLTFSREQEALFLLDEPDTHLNPAWKLYYLQMLQEWAGENSDSHIIISTHDPLTIAGLEQSQVQVMYWDDGRVRVQPPLMDPRGLGVTGILTQVFGLPTTLDPQTQELLDHRNRLLRLEERSLQQETDLRNFSEQLAHMGFMLEARNPEYERYLRAVEEIEKPERQTYTPEDVERQNKIAQQIIAKLRGQPIQ